MVALLLLLPPLCFRSRYATAASVCNNNIIAQTMRDAGAAGSTAIATIQRKIAVFSQQATGTACFTKYGLCMRQVCSYALHHECSQGQWGRNINRRMGSLGEEEKQIAHRCCRDLILIELCLCCLPVPPHQVGRGKASHHPSCILDRPQLGAAPRFPWLKLPPAYKSNPEMLQQIRNSYSKLD